MPRLASRRGSRDSPESMTSRTPGTVREDSASAVETMIRAAAAGIASGDGAVLLGRAGLAVEFQHFRAAARPRRRAGDVGDLPGARDEHQGVKVPSGSKRGRVPSRGRVRHVVKERAGHAPFVQPGRRCGRPFDCRAGTARRDSR